MNKRSNILCKSYHIAGANDRLQHVLAPKKKWFGLVKGEFCVLCGLFISDKSLKFWKKNDC